MSENEDETLAISDKVEILSTEDEKIKAVGEILSSDSSRKILKLLAYIFFCVLINCSIISIQKIFIQFCINCSAIISVFPRGFLLSAMVNIPMAGKKKTGLCT